MGLRQAVIFDVDGTLVDSNNAHARAWEEAFRDLGLPVPFRCGPSPARPSSSPR